MGLDGFVLQTLNMEAWLRLVCCLYLTKHKTLFHSEQIGALHNSPCRELSPDNIRLLKCLAYTDIKPFTSLSDWHNFTHRVCFHHSSGTKHHESLLIPSLGALKFHMLRSIYVLKLLCSCTGTTSLPESFHIEHGWKLVNRGLQVVWDVDDVFTSFSQSNKSCSCKGGCDGSRAGCKNCFEHANLVL